jgi:hypothetical protein
VEFVNEKLGVLSPKYREVDMEEITPKVKELLTGWRKKFDRVDFRRICFRLV